MRFAVCSETDEGLLLASYVCVTDQIWFRECVAANQLLARCSFA
jgi:hypothetical protein